MSANKFLKAPRFCSRSCRTSSIQSLPRKSKGKENSTRILAVRNVELINSKKNLQRQNAAAQMQGSK